MVVSRKAPPPPPLVTKGSQLVEVEHPSEGTFLYCTISRPRWTEHGGGDGTITDARQGL